MFFFVLFIYSEKQQQGVEQQFSLNKCSDTFCDNLLVMILKFVFTE